MQASAPIVSIITAVFNKEKFVAETISSVLNQTYKSWELLLVDDCSTDNSLSAIRPFLQDKRIRLIENSRNGGANKCRNQGLHAASGSYAMFLDADDVLAPFCLEQRIRAAAENSSANLLVFAMGVFYKTAGDDKREWQPRSQQPLKDFLMHKLPWSIMQPFWRTDFIKKIGGFNEKYSRLQDVELHTRALLHTEVSYRQFAGTPDCYYRIDESRQNFVRYEFLRRWLAASIQYCEDFSGKLGRERNYLKGTLFAIYCQIGFQTKTGAISKEESRQLLALIKASHYWKQLGTGDRLIWKMAYLNNFVRRVPGINFILLRLLTAV